jgi:hypothetical protein
MGERRELRGERKEKGVLAARKCSDGVELAHYLDFLRRKDYSLLSPHYSLN